MIRRPFYAMLGLGAGIALGVVGMRRLQEVQRKLSPQSLVRSAGARAGSLRERVTLAIEEARAAAAEKEAELRGVYRVRQYGSPNGHSTGSSDAV